MKSVTISATTQERKAPVAPQQQQLPKEPATQKFHVLPLSPFEDPQARVAKRAMGSTVSADIGMDRRSMIGSTQSGKF